MPSPCFIGSDTVTARSGDAAATPDAVTAGSKAPLVAPEKACERRSPGAPLEPAGGAPFDDEEMSRS